jgi:3-hydroxymyristoyl/3-hydroxydecanoyl-(acyl carrier protein) dehydratase
MVNGFDPEDPALPQPVVVEALAQTCGLLMNVQYMIDHHGMTLDELRDPVKFAAAGPPPLSVLAESRVTHHGLARPGDKVSLDCGFTLKRRDLASFRVEARIKGSLLAVGTMILAYPTYTARPGHKK